MDKKKFHGSSVTTEEHNSDDEVLSPDAEYGGTMGYDDEDMKLSEMDMNEYSTPQQPVVANDNENEEGWSNCNDLIYDEQQYTNKAKQHRSRAITEVINRWKCICGFGML